jgi:hypothetical protein
MLMMEAGLIIPLMGVNVSAGAGVTGDIHRRKFSKAHYVFLKNHLIYSLSSGFISCYYGFAGRYDAKIIPLYALFSIYFRR